MTNAAFRFSAYYSAFYLTLGAFLPYFPIWLEGRGFSPEWIGLIAAAGLAGRTLVSPLGARWAEASSDQRRPILVFAIISLSVFSLHALQMPAATLTVLAFIAGAAFYGQIPLIDSFALNEARHERLNFGPVRAFGSVTFIIANFAAGALIDRYGSESVIAWIILGCGLTGLWAALLPAGKRDPRPAGVRNGWVELGRLVMGPFGLVLLASTMIQGAHAFYYVFSAASWSAQGYSKLLIGGLWSIGVAIEVAFLWMSGRGLLARLSPGMLLALGGGASILRWGLTALSPPLWGLVLLQALHAFTFAATYIGFLRYVTRHIPDHQSTTAQAINSALSGGVVLAAASAISGYLYDIAGAAGFAAMIVPAGIGLVAAIQHWRVSGLPTREEID